MAAGTSRTPGRGELSARERVARLAPVVRDKTKAAYRIADELRRLGAQLDDAVADLAHELEVEPTPREDTEDGRRAA